MKKREKKTTWHITINARVEGETPSTPDGIMLTGELQVSKIETGEFEAKGKFLVQDQKLAAQVIRKLKWLTPPE